MTALDPVGRLFDVAALPHALTLADRFVLPPFSVLDARGGWWQDRKRLWHSLGIESEIGRTARTFVGAGTRADAYAQALRDRTGPDTTLAEKLAIAAELGIDEVSARSLAISKGQSIFDPVLTELAYRWFCPPGGLVLDPFAGGSVRGIVAGVTGARYNGVDLSAPQVVENRRQADAILPAGHGVKWAVGDSRAVLAGIKYTPGARPDLVFSCPPYHDLEVYSDDPADISTMPWPAFLDAYREIIRLAVGHLAPDRFAVWVIGEIRTGPRGVYRGLVPATIAAFEDTGANYYNELILVQPAGTLQLRTATPFGTSRKLGRTHQTALVFVKGDPKVAASACGTVLTGTEVDDA